MKKGFSNTINEAIRALYSYSFQHEHDADALRRIFLLNFSMDQNENECASADPLLEPSGQLASGVLVREKELDQELKQYLRGWKLERLGLIELLLLRTGLFALKYQNCEENEVLSAVRKVASAYGLDDARKFLTGVFTAWVKNNKTDIA